jgi:vacuolar-type H+-ATPase subunit E/Vma4
MGSRELIESLRRTGEESIRLQRNEAEQEVAALQASLSGQIADLRRRYAEELAAAEREESRRALADAGSRIRAIKLDAEKKLSDRLLSIAGTSLTQLRQNGYSAVFEKLVKELPLLSWGVVRVHPADIDLARRHFPGAEIVPTETITGGMDATTGDGTIRAINTFEKRLELAWLDLLPKLISDVYQEISDGTPQKTP